MRLLYLFLLASLTWSCAELEDKNLSSPRKTSNVTVTETNGTVIGDFDKDASGTQVLVASNNSEVKDVAADVGPGTLTLDAKVTLGEAKSILATNTQLPAELGGGLATMGTAPVYFNDDQNQALAGTIAISIPLPLSEKKAVQLMGESSKVALLYVMRIAGVWKIGLYPLDGSDLNGAYVLFNATGFGYFQIVILPEKATAVETDAAVSSTPEIK